MYKSSGGRDGRTADYVAGGISVLISGGIAYFHLWPYRWLADLQGEMMGGRYYPALTWLAVALAVAMPVVLVSRALFGSHESAHLAGFGKYAMRNQRHVQISALAVIGLCAGAFLWIRALSYGPLVEVPLSALEDQSSSARFVRISGYEMDFDGAIEVSSSRIYVPLRSPRPGRTFVTVELSQNELSVLTPGAPLGGVLRTDGMPNEVRVIYEDAQRLAPGALTLELNATPMGDQYFGLGLLIVSLFVAAGAGYYYVGVIRPVDAVEAAMFTQPGTVPTSPSDEPESRGADPREDV